MTHIQEIDKFPIHAIPKLFNPFIPKILEDKFDAEPFYIDLRTSKTQEDVSLKNPIFKKEVLKLAAHLHDKAPKDMVSDEVRMHKKMLRYHQKSL